MDPNDTNALTGEEIETPDPSEGDGGVGSSWFTLQLKTRSPQAKITIGNGTGYIGTRDVNVYIVTEDEDVVAYRLWGDIAGDQPAGGTAVKTEEEAEWITLDSPSQFPVIPVRFFDGELPGSDVSQDEEEAYEGLKTLNLQVMDGLGNISGLITATVQMDLSVPEPVVFNGPAPQKISKMPGKNISRFSFMVNEDINEYAVCVVPSKSASVDMGVRIGTEFGSLNMYGSKTQNGVIVSADEVVECEITGADLQAASPLDGFKTIKVFVKNLAGLWSV